MKRQDWIDEVIRNPSDYINDYDRSYDIPKIVAKFQCSEGTARKLGIIARDQYRKLRSKRPLDSPANTESVINKHDGNSGTGE